MPLSCSIREFCPVCLNTWSVSGAGDFSMTDYFLLMWITQYGSLLHLVFIIYCGGSSFFLLLKLSIQIIKLNLLIQNQMRREVPQPLLIMTAVVRSDR